MAWEEKKCKACEGGVEPMAPEEADKHLAELEGWSRDGGRIMKTYRFDDFKATMAFVQKLALLAEEEGHHPDLDITYGKVGLSLTTHAIGGLSENDFIIAAKADKL